MKKHLTNLKLQGGFAYSPEQIEELEPWLLKGDSIRVLELGAGDSSVKLCEGLKSKYKNVKYVCYETSEQWAPKHDNIEVRLHTNEQLKAHAPAVQLGEDEIYDFILVDGPTGVIRWQWYALIKDHAAPGAIIHIDDYSHYAEFEQALRDNFPNFEELSRVERGEINPHTWLTVKVL